MSKDPQSTHYDAGGIEVYEVIKAKLTPEQFKGYQMGNAIKYLLRANFKGTFERDLAKANNYLSWMTEEEHMSIREAVEQLRKENDDAIVKTVVDTSKPTKTLSPYTLYWARWVYLMFNEKSACYYMVFSKYRPEFSDLSARGPRVNPHDRLHFIRLMGKDLTTTGMQTLVSVDDLDIVSKHSGWNETLLKIAKDAIEGSISDTVVLS